MKYPLLFASLLVACSASSSPDDMLAPGPGNDGAVGPSYAGTFTANRLATITFAATTNDATVQSIHITDGVGTLEFEHATWPAVVYEVIPFSPYLLASIVATTSDGIVVTYAYCKDGALQSMYFESLQVPDTVQLARPIGTCTLGTTPAAVTAVLTPPGPLVYAPLTDRADVDATDLSIHGGAGTMTLDGTSYDVSVFTTVDCSTCGGAGWQELHITLTKGSTLAFAILYLQADQPTQVRMYYGFRFDMPSLWPADRAFSGAWTLK